MRWLDLRDELLANRPQLFTFAPPCDEAFIEQLETEMGGLPAETKAMLLAFNGAELFVDAITFVTLLGIRDNSSNEDADWTINNYSATWRKNMARPTDWILAITSYGGLHVVDGSGVIKEWDSSSSRWSPFEWSYSEWIRYLLDEGEKTIEE